MVWEFLEVALNKNILKVVSFRLLMKSESERSSDNHKFTIERAVFGAIGMACPFPIIGELCLSAPIYTAISRSRLSNSRGINITSSVAIAGLMRVSLYEPFYIPMLRYVFG